MSVAVLTWPYIERSIDALVATFEGLDGAGRSWRPPAPGTNSIATLVNHTVANAADNLLGTVCGVPAPYDRQADFDHPDVDPATVRAKWEAVRRAFQARVASITDADLLGTVEHPRRGAVTRLEALVVVARHAAEHLAHAELTRDLYLASKGATR